MKYKKSKFSLIFRIISLVLIQAFMVLDFAWAINGELPAADKVSDSAKLSPKINLNSQEIIKAYVYSLKNYTKIDDLPGSAEPLPRESNQPAVISRRDFFKTAATAAVGAAAAITIPLTAPRESKARDLAVDLKDLVVSFDKGVSEPELNKYIAIIESQGLKKYTLDKDGEKTIIRIQGLFPLDAEKLADSLNAQANGRNLSNKFVITASEADWENSQTYINMKAFAAEVADISTRLGFAEINPKDLVGLYEGITWVESKFNQWEIDASGKIRAVRSYTNAIGVTQVIESQAVQQLARLIASHKGGISRYSGIIVELQRIISSDSEKVKKALKDRKPFVEETADQKQFNVYDDLMAYKNAASDKEKQRQLIIRIHRKINSNPKLLGVNLYYALAAWEYLQERNNLQAGITSELAKSIGKAGEALGKEQGQIIGTGSGAYKPTDIEQAVLQFQRDYFRFNILYEMINSEKITEILRGDEAKIFENITKYLAEQMMTKIGNQKLGYTYLTLNWDRYRRLELAKNKGGDKKYIFRERPLSYFKNHHNNFSVELAAAASYNSGTGSVEDALLNFGNAADANGIPLWIKNMVGANPQNIREPINYLRAFLEDKFFNTGNLSEQELKVKNYLIQERYKRIYKAGVSLLEARDLVLKNGVQVYAEYKRQDSFNYHLAASLAQVLGSDSVDSFLRTYGFDKAWEDQIFSRNSTLDSVAAVLFDNKSPSHQAAREIKKYLDGKKLAYLNAQIAELESREQARIARMELAQQVAKDNEIAKKNEEWEKTKDYALGVAKNTGIGAAALTVAAGLVWIMKRRVQLGKEAVPSAAYKVPLKIFWFTGLLTVKIFAVSGRILLGAFSLISGSLGKRNHRVIRANNRVLGSQKPVINRRVNSANRYRNKQQPFSLGKWLKKLFTGTLFFVILTAPFLSPALLYGSQTQPQAPPATSSLSQQEFNKSLIEISKISDYSHVDKSGQLVAIRTNLDKNLNGNGKARDRGKEINKVADRLWVKALVRGDLPEYITKRGDSEEAVAIGKGLLILKAAVPEFYQDLEANKARIYIGDIPGNAYTTGSRLFGLMGEPIVYINKNFIKDPFKIAFALSHESFEVSARPKDSLDLALYYNPVALVRDILFSIPQNEIDSFKRQNGFAKVFNIVPIKDNSFYDLLKLEIAYNAQKNAQIGLDLVGTSLFYIIIPLLFGWLVVEKFKDNKVNPSVRAKARILGDQQIIRRLKSNALVRSIILVPFIIFQFMSFNSPAISQATDAFNLAGQKTEITNYQNEHIVTVITGTSIKINSHFGPQEGKHNNVLGDWAEAVIKGDIQPGADIVRFDWHADDSGAVMDADLEQWANIKNLKTEQEKINAVHELAANLRIDAFNYPAYLNGPTGLPILGNTFWVHQEAEWQGKVKQEDLVVTPYAIEPTNHPEQHPNDKQITRYSLNANDMSKAVDFGDLKDGFILDFDLDYFTLHREDFNWDYLNQLLQSDKADLRKLAESMLKTVHNQPSREQMQQNIDQVIAQFKELAKKGIKPGLIDIAESPNFTPNKDAEWVKEQLIKGFESIYSPSQDAAVKAKNPAQEASKAVLKKVGITGFITVISASIANLFAAADLWALDNGAEKVFASADLKSILIGLFVIGAAVFIVKWTVQAMGLFKPNDNDQKYPVTIPSQPALEKIKTLDNDIRGLFAQGKNRVIIAIDGPSGAGKTTLANYIKATGIAGIDPSDIQVLSRDDYAVAGDYAEANVTILEKSMHRGKLIILDGHGIQWASKILSGEENYANPDVFVKITAKDTLRRQRLEDKGLAVSEVEKRMAANDPAGDFDLIIEQPYESIIGGTGAADITAPTPLLPEPINHQDNSAVIQEETISVQQPSLPPEAGSNPDISQNIQLLTPAELEKEKALYEQTIKLLGRSRICDLPNRQRYIEDLVEALKQKKAVQVAFLSIQNFKGEFNDLGVELDDIAASYLGKRQTGIFGHFFGDKAIQTVAEALPQALENALKTTGIKAHVYNDAKSYWVIFEDIPDGFDINTVLNDLLKADSDFKQQVIAEIKNLTQGNIAAAELDAKTIERLNERLDLFTVNNFNIYGGISQQSDMLPEAQQKDTVEIANVLDTQAILEAKYQQIDLGGGALREMVDENISQFNPVPKADAERLKEKIVAHINAARKTPVSRIGVYSDKTWLDAQLHRQYGQRNEWESMYQPVSHVYDAKNTDVKLLASYDQAIARKDKQALDRAKNAVYRKIAIYNLDQDVETRAKGAIYSGNENFKIMINYLIINQPKKNWSGTFRIGGDELGKVVWDAEKHHLSIYRFDINNLGKVNFQWGMRIGDKLIDEVLRLVDEISQNGRYMRDVYRFFNNEPNGTGRIFSDLRWQLDDADYLFIVSELRYLGKNVEDYISIEGNKYFLKKIPEVNIPVRDQQTGQLLELYAGLGESLDGISEYQSMPAVSGGVVSVDTDAVHALAVQGENIERDFSFLQGRADGTAEAVKAKIKESQAQNNGEILEQAFAQADTAMVSAEFIAARAIKSFNEHEPRLIENNLAEYMLNYNSAMNQPDFNQTNTVAETDYSSGIISRDSAKAFNHNDLFSVQQSI